jgi:DNA-binding response OmpR family regulator
MLLQHVWNYDFDGNDNVLDVYISYLRKKLDRGTSPSMIQTVRGIGYRMGGADA